ncbi:MAG: autotransporter-associated beta strand repeat-containing protein [Luteolibacter sp.]|uniref:beta strand repeat-containing protein n=1 Tax=Luteolibacter sp. TaxID=1962973 RepID=UPI0032639C9F
MKFRNLGYPSLRFPLSTITLACCVGLTAPLHALDYTWTGTTSNAYNVKTNWSPNTPNDIPPLADNVLINTNTPNPTNVPSGNWDRRGAGTTTINGTGAVNVITGSARLLNNGSFSMLGGQLITNGEYFIVGSNGVGTFTQSGGTIDSTLKRGFFLSDANGDSGSVYNLSAGTLSVKSATDSAVGEDLRGVWFGKGINGASTDKFNVTGSTATFEKTGGSTANLQLSGSAEINITTGTVTFDKYTEARIGYQAATADLQSKINVNSGTLNFTNAAGSTNVRIGYNDKGLLKIDGGTVNIKGLLGIGTTANTPLDAGEGLCQMSAGAMNVTGNLNVGTTTSKGTLTMTGGTLTETNTGVDIIGGGNGGVATVNLSGTSILNAATTKWKTGDFGGTGNTGTTSISLSGSAALTLKEFTIGHIGSATATETVSLSGTSILTVNNFVTIGRDDNTAQSGIVSSLNLNGGTLATTYIQKGADDSTVSKNNVNANGGTIKALAAQTDFFKLGTLNPGRVYVNLQSGGLNFDTNNFDVGFQTGLHGTGGLTKQGAGTLTLSNLDDYTGTTTVSAGTLLTTTGNFPGTSCVVADGTTLAVTGDAYQSWKTTGLTLGSATGVTVDIRNFNPATGVPAIDATSSLVPHGTVTLKVSGIPVVGTYPLISYPVSGSIGGSGIGAFQLAPLPRGVVANVIDSNNAVSLQVTAINVLKWKGNVDSIWDINTTSNWTLGASPDKYLENDNTQFNDSATSTAITLNSVVSPASVTFDHTSKDYTLSGTGRIAGPTVLNKLGDGMLTLATANTYTGITTVNAGTLRLGDGVSDGSLTSPLVVNDASVIFNTTGSPVLSGALSGYGSATNLTKTGAGTQIFTGTSNTYSGLLQITQGTFQFGDGTVNGSMGSTTTYDIAAGGKLRFNSTVAATAAWDKITGAGVVSLNSAQLVNATADWGAFALTPSFTGTLRVEKGRVGANNGKDAFGAASKIQILDGAQLLAFTSVDPYTTPVEIAGSGWGEGGYPGGLRLAGSATATWAGSVTLTADSGIMAQRLANFTITGSISGPFQCEFYAGDPVGDSGTINVAPAAVQNSYASTKINGRPNGSTIAGNANAFSSGPLVVAESMLKLNGFNFTFANLSGTGGKISNSHAANPSVITVGGDNTSTAYSGVILDGGTAALGIVKTGTGTLSLTGSNSYSGATTVSQGTLSITSPTLGDASTVTVASGAHLDLATGTSSDTVGVLILGGVTMLPGTYNPSHPTYGAFFTGTGSLVVASGYSSWATSKGLDGTNNGLTQDADNDGVSNLMEFYLNGNPLTSDSQILPVQTSDATYVILTFSRRDDAEADVTSQTAQYGSTLTGWTDAVIGAGDSGPDVNGVTVTVAENLDAPDTINVRIPRANAVGRKIFGRLKVAK